MFDRDNTFMWVLAAVAAVTVGGIVWAANSSDDTPHDGAVLTPSLAPGAAPTAVPNTVYVQQPAHNDHGIMDAVLLHHVLNSGSSNSSTHTTTHEVHYVPSAPAPVRVATPVSYSAPKPTPAPAVTSTPKPSYTPVSRPVSAIRSSGYSAPARSSYSPSRSSGRK